MMTVYFILAFFLLIMYKVFVHNRRRKALGLSFREYNLYLDMIEYISEKYEMKKSEIDEKKVYKRLIELISEL